LGCGGGIKLIVESRGRGVTIKESLQSQFDRTGLRTRIHIHGSSDRVFEVLAETGEILKRG
jgi:hypothetical protein